jgi:hypothetical protein
MAGTRLTRHASFNAICEILNSSEHSDFTVAACDFTVEMDYYSERPFLAADARELIYGISPTSGMPNCEKCLVMIDEALAARRIFPAKSAV